MNNSTIPHSAPASAHDVQTVWTVTGYGADRNGMMVCDKAGCHLHANLFEMQAFVPEPLIERRTVVRNGDGELVLLGRDSSRPDQLVRPCRWHGPQAEYRA